MNVLEISLAVIKGIPFINLEGIITPSNFFKLGQEINQLLYDVGFKYFVFDFSNTSTVEDTIYNDLQSKLVEILLNCGQVVLCGIDNKEKIGYTEEQLYYVNNRLEAFNYLYL